MGAEHTGAPPIVEIIETIPPPPPIVEIIDDEQDPSQHPAITNEVMEDPANISEPSAMNMDIGREEGEVHNVAIIGPGEVIMGDRVRVRHAVKKPATADFIFASEAWKEKNDIQTMKYADLGHYVAISFVTPIPYVQFVPKGGSLLCGGNNFAAS